MNTIAGFDIFISSESSTQTVLYQARNLPITADNVLVLCTSGQRHVLIATHQKAEYQDYIEANLEALLGHHSIHAEERSQVPYESATGPMQAILEAPRAPDMIKRSKDMVANASSFLRSERVAFEHLLSLISFDSYTYAHSVDVFMFSYMLAQHAGHTDSQLLRELGEGALLHDVGKSLLDSSIVQSADPLTDAQWMEMRKHPVYGYEILREHGAFSELSLDIVLHHHEKLCGGGYPDNLREDQIHPMVRIVTIAGIFDAMTIRRSYRDALDSSPALRTMRDQMSDTLDSTFFRKFVDMMGNPSGTKPAQDAV